MYAGILTFCKAKLLADNYLNPLANFQTSSSRFYKCKSTFLQRNKVKLCVKSY